MSCAVSPYEKDMINDSIPKSDEPTNRIPSSFAERIADDGVWTLDTESGKY